MAVDYRPRKKSWFGPKRIGYGLRPQNWQGRLVTAAIAGILVMVKFLVG